MLGTEGVAARVYWQVLSEQLPPSWRFNGRSRRPAKDNFNAALNYLFGMLYNTVEQACLAAGLDPMLGYLHVDDYLKTTFVFDAIEPFRPWVEILLVQKILTTPNQSSFFTKKKEGIFLNKKGRKFYISEFNNFMNQSII